MAATLALLSDRLFMATVGVYVLALVLHGVALARSVAPAGLVAAGPAAAAGAVGTGTAAGTATVATPDRPGGAQRFARMGVALVVLGALLHAGSLVARGLAAQRWPLGNMYEFTSAICLAAVVAWLVLLRRAARTSTEEGGRLVAAGPFVLLPVVVLLFLAGTVLYAQAAPVQPALQSYWLVVHVTTICVSSGMLLVSGVASVLHLVRRAGRAAWLPAADVLDRVAYRVTIVAFPVYTFAVIAGAIWAEAAWGRFWGWDPKETVAFVAWVVYAAYLHARATAGWRAGGAAWINVAGFAVIAFNLFFINMVVAGLHSYAGI
ncbi:MAG: c-type cytochrome biogenesis protein CcsB [Pseudonocardia sp.]